MLDTAKQEYEALKQLCKKASQRRFPRTSTQVVPIDDLCEEVISLARDWVDRYKPHIQHLNPGNMRGDWISTTEGVRDRLCEFKRVLSSQQANHPLLETVDKIREEVEELIQNHIYL